MAPNDKNTDLADSSSNASTQDITAIYLTLMAFILSQIIIMFIINYVGVFDKISKNLTDLAQEGCRRRSLYMKRQTTTETDMIDKGHAAVVEEMHSKDDKANCCRPHPKWHLDIRFFEMLGNKKSYFGSVDGWFPNGKFYCFLYPKGYIEDLIFYIFNNHFWFSSFLCVRGHPFTRVQRLAAFFVQVVLCFFFTNLIMTGFEVPEQTQTVVEIFLITPLSLMLRKTFYYLESCPCLLVKKRGGDINAKRWTKAGKFIGIIFLLGLFGLHYLGSIYAGRARVLGFYLHDRDALGKVAYSTMLVAMFSDFVVAYIKFLDGKTGISFKALNGKINGDNLIGGWYNHYINENELVEGVHYRKRVLDLCIMQIVYVREISGSSESVKGTGTASVVVTDTIVEDTNLNVEMV